MDATDTTIEADGDALADFRREAHPGGFACAPQHPFGLRIALDRTEAHRVEGRFSCGRFFQGYPGRIHGGIVSTLLDSAMAQALMAEGIEAYTVDLRIRFRDSVEVGVPARVTGEWLGHCGPVHHMEARLEQNGKVEATAEAKFFVCRREGRGSSVQNL